MHATSIAATDRTPPSAIEHVFAVGSLFFFADAVRSLILNPSGEGTVSLGSDPISLPGLLLIYSLVTILLTIHWRESMRTLARVPWLLGVLLLAWISSLWSTDAEATTKSAVWLTGSTLFGIYLHQRFGLRGLIRVLAAMSMIIIVLSILFVALSPRLGIDPGLHANAWRGVFLHKNSFGRMMTLSAIVFWILALDTPRVKPLFVVLALSAVGLLLMSRSAASLAVGVCIALLFVFRNVIVGASQTETKRFTRILGFTVLAVVLAIYYRDALLGLLGKDSSFTGRTLLWAAIIQEILARPWLGFGFQAFWSGNTAEFARVWSFVQWAPPNAHNGYLDVILHFGLLGGAYVLLGFTAVASRALRFASRASPSTFWPGAFVAYFLLGNVSETALLQQNPFFWILFCSVVCSIADASQADAGSQPAARGPGQQGSSLTVLSETR